MAGGGRGRRRAVDWLGWTSVPHCVGGIPKWVHIIMLKPEKKRKSLSCFPFCPAASLCPSFPNRVSQEFSRLACLLPHPPFTSQPSSWAPLKLFFIKVTHEIFVDEDTPPSFVSPHLVSQQSWVVGHVVPETFLHPHLVSFPPLPAPPRPPSWAILALLPP